jgi:hypothetical protein
VGELGGCLQSDGVHTIRPFLLVSPL